MWKVLIAEDNDRYCKNLLDALEGLGECSIAKTGEEAITLHQEAVKSKKFFDFILLDVTMPKGDGFAVLKAIRQEEEKSAGTIPEARIIMVTAYKDSLMEKYNMGWDDFITKPIEKEKLLSHMKNLLVSS